MKPDVIALTGFIGSGKSQVASILRSLGYKTVDCDLLARQIADEPDVVEQVSQLLGERYVSDGKLNRKLVRERVFADKDLLAKYQSLFFDKVRRRLENIVEQTQDTLFVEIAVIDAFPFCWNGIWLVRCDPAQSVCRVALRDGVNEQSVLDVIASQREPTPTCVIENNGTIADLENAVRAALKSCGLVCGR